MINFHPLQISVFYSFCYWFSIKLLFFWGGGGWGAFISRVFYLILVKLFIVCVFIISQGCRANLYENDGLLTRIVAFEVRERNP